MDVNEFADCFPKDDIDLRLMNRTLRHRLRNLCSGVKMTVKRIGETTAETHPQIPTRCDIIVSELDGLQRFTERMDSLFDTLPTADPKSLFDLISSLRETFSKKYPFCSLDLEGPEAMFGFAHGNWLLTMLSELLDNAGEAAGSEGRVTLSWSDSAPLVITIVNNGTLLPEDIDLKSLSPFRVTRSRHDGIGLPIAYRICRAINGQLSIDNRDDLVVTRITIPEEELTHG